MNQKLIDAFFEEIKDQDKINKLKNRLGEIKIDHSEKEHENFLAKSEFIQYLEYKEKFRSAEDLVNKSIELAKGKDPRAVHDLAISGNTYKLLLQNALNNWLVLGYKNEIEKIIKETI